MLISLPTVIIKCYIRTLSDPIGPSIMVDMQTTWTSFESSSFSVSLSLSLYEMTSLLTPKWFFRPFAFLVFMAGTMRSGAEGGGNLCWLSTHTCSQGNISFPHVDCKINISAKYPQSMRGFSLAGLRLHFKGISYKFRHVISTNLICLQVVRFKR